MQELRQHERVQFIQSVEVTALPGDKIKPGMSVDLSLGGVGVATSATFAMGQLVQVTFFMNNKDTHVASDRVIGRVVRLIAESDGTILGIRFLSTLEEIEHPLLVQRLMKVEGSACYGF